MHVARTLAYLSQIMVLQSRHVAKETELQHSLHLAFTMVFLIWWHLKHDINSKVKCTKEIAHDHQTQKIHMEELEDE